MNIHLARPDYTNKQTRDGNTRMGSTPSNQKNRPLAGIEIYIDNYIYCEKNSPLLGVRDLHSTKIKSFT